MNIDVGPLESPPTEHAPVEIVERKGTGHPDTICDALAERLSRRLSRFYLDNFGLVLHHNVDKVLLVGGAAEPAFGGGRIVKPIDIYMAGRATDQSHGIRVPVEDFAVEGSRDWLHEHLRALDVVGGVSIHCVVKPGSQDLVELFERAARTGVRLANDTSCGVGYAPLSPLESIAYETERLLNSAKFKARHPAAGEDVKVMAVRRGSHVAVTISCAMIGRHLATLQDYVTAKTAIAEDARACASQIAGHDVSVAINAADDIDAGSVYLTVSGTSAESGDDGEAGRGNRANGLITPYRPMTMESCAGKNPVTHVGKLYNVAAGLIAEQIVAEVPEVAEAQCRIVSRIGSPIADPDMLDVRYRLRHGRHSKSVRRPIERIARWRLDALDALCDGLVAGDVAIDRWPLGHPRAEQTWREDRRRLIDDIEAEARLVSSETGRTRYAPAVIAAMGRVPRHEFVPTALREAAYANAPLPIGHHQTISQPLIMALITDLVDIDPTSRVLEIGTGSGYQCAVLAEIADEVFSIEIVEPLAQSAITHLRRLGYDNATVRAGDGYQGWPEHAPFDAIIVTAGAPEVPAPLIDQLKPGGRLVAPIGSVGRGQNLRVIEKRKDGSTTERVVLPVAFVPFERGPVRRS